MGKVRERNKGEHKKKEHFKKKTGQAEQLKQLVKQVYTAVGICIVIVLGFAVFNFLLSRMQAAQLNAALALDQYRTASKTLTYSVQSYAVTGDKKYYDAYMYELEEEKNREAAVAILQKCNLTKEEMENLEQIAKLSEALVPLEEEAMAYVNDGKLKAAQACVYSEEYGESVDRINEFTEKTIAQVLDRKEMRQNFM